MGYGKARLAVIAGSWALAAGSLATAGCMLAGGSLVMSGVPMVPTPWPMATSTVAPGFAPGQPPSGSLGSGAGPIALPRFRGPIAGGGFGTRPHPQPDTAEAPLAVGGAIQALEPAPPLLANESDTVSFGNGSPFYVWRDDSGDNVMVGEAGGAIRRLGTWNHGTFWPRFSDGGRHVLVKDFAMRPSGVNFTSQAQRYTLYSLAGGIPVLSADLPSDTYYDPLPDGSGLTRLVVTQAGGPPSVYQPTPSPVNAPALSDLVTLAPGGKDLVEASLPAVRHYAWSLDSRKVAAVGFRNGDALQGMDIVVHDRATKDSRLLYHLETDYFVPPQQGNFRWTSDNRVAFAQVLQFGASASISITSIPTETGPAVIDLFPLALAPGESAGTPLMSPDAKAVAFSLLRPVQVTGDGWSATIPSSQGIWVGTSADGKIRQVAERGRPVAWLPDSKSLICATGRGRHIRYYVVDTSPQQGGGQ